MTTTETPARRDYLGRAVQDGRVRFLSPSSLEKADPRSPGGCLRSWWYRYVGGHKEPEKPWQAEGTRYHAEVERYLRTGERALSAPVLPLLPFIPSPGPDLLVEESLVGEAGLEGAVLTVAGIPVVGRLDLLQARGEWLDSAGELRAEPNQDTAEYVDWKFPSSFDHVKTADALARDTKTLAGAEWLARRFPSLAWIRLSHGYALRGRTRDARKTTVLVERGDVARAWEPIGAVARSVVDAAREPDPDKVDASVSSCDAYGGCPHRAYCRAGSHDSLAALFGDRGAAALMQRAFATTQKEETVLIDSKLMPGAAGSPAPAPVTPLTPPAGVGAQLAIAPPGCPPGFAEAAQAVRMSGRGFPTLGGAAARAYAIANGYAPADGYAGSGDLAPCSIVEPAQLTALAMELGCPPALLVAGARTADGQLFAPPPIQPPAPSSWPAAAAAAPSWPPPPPQGGAIAALLPPDAPASSPPAASAPPVAAPLAFAAQAAATEPKRGRGRPKKTEAPAHNETTVVAALPAAVQAAQPSQPPAEAEPDAGPDRVEVYVDCIPNQPYESLWPLVDQWCQAIARHFNVPDMRQAPQDSPIGYGKWKPALEGMVREGVRAGGVPAGAYVLDTRGSEVAEVVAVALRMACDDVGADRALFVRGTGR